MITAFRLTVLAQLLACLAALPASAASFQTLYRFRGGADGAFPDAGLLIGSNGLLYGTTVSGGSGNGGTVFQFDTMTGLKTVLYAFTLGDKHGSEPSAALIADAHGNLYGTTETGGDTTNCSYGCGVVFRLTPKTGKLKLLHVFSGLTDGRLPLGELVFGADGKLYGTTDLGGETSGNCGASGCGTVFQLDPATQTLVTLHDFTGSPGDGDQPSAGLVFDTAGKLYGTTSTGSTGSNNGSGTVFRLDPATNAYSVLHYFDYATDGAYLTSTLSFVNNVLYGTAAAGGPTAAADGTVFQIDPASGAVTTLYSFQGPPDDGEGPAPGASSGKHGVLLGITTQGGSGHVGTVYSLDPVKLTYKLLHVFSGGSDGAVPAGRLAVTKKGVAYGVTSYGNGTVFSITP